MDRSGKVFRTIKDDGLAKLKEFSDNTFEMASSTIIQRRLFMGVEEKKAMRDLTEQFEKEGLTSIKTATGNNGLTVEFNFDPNLKSGEIRVASENLNSDFVNGMKLVCQDADYLEEIAKISKMRFSVVPKLENKSNGIFGSVTCDAGTMVISIDGCHSLGGGETYSVRDALKKCF